MEITESELDAIELHSALTKSIVDKIHSLQLIKITNKIDYIKSIRLIKPEIPMSKLLTLNFIYQNENYLICKNAIEKLKGCEIDLHTEVFYLFPKCITRFCK